METTVLANQQETFHTNIYWYVVSPAHTKDLLLGFQSI